MPALGQSWALGLPPGRHSWSPSTALFQGSAPILVAMVILLNIGVALLFINFFI